MLYTTLKLLREHNACSSGLLTLIGSLESKHSETQPISLAHILKSNGLNHAIWALRATTVDAHKIAARMSIDFAFEVIGNFEKQFPEDKGPRGVLEQAKLFLDGKITLKEMRSARSAGRRNRSRRRRNRSRRRRNRWRNRRGRRCGRPSGRRCGRRNRRNRCGRRCGRRNRRNGRRCGRRNRRRNLKMQKFS